MRSRSSFVAVGAAVWLLGACTLLNSLDGFSEQSPRDDAAATIDGRDESATRGDASIDGSADGTTDSADAAVVEPFPDSLVGYWPLDEGSGTTANDRSGKNNHGALKNAPMWTTGRRGGALSFDGVDQSVEVLSLSGAKFPTSGTVSIWLMAPFADQTNRPIFDGFDPARRHLYIRQVATAAATLQISGQFVDAGSLAWNGTAPVTPNAWVHVVLVWNTVTHHATTFVDGAAIFDDTFSATWVPDQQQVAFAQKSCCGSFKGLLDELRLYDRALSAAEVLMIP
jgi:hypothetical protein